MRGTREKVMGAKKGMGYLLPHGDIEAVRIRFIPREIHFALLQGRGEEAKEKIGTNIISVSRRGFTMHQ